ASSLNVPAVRVLTMVGPVSFTRTLVRLGLPLNRSGDFYGYSLALGSADVTLLSLTNAYRTLANHGRHSPVRFLVPESVSPDRNEISDMRIQDQTGDRVLDPSAVW